MSRADFRKHLLVLGACLVATLAAYLPSLGNTFAMDDRFIAKATLDDGTPNAMVAEMRPIAEYFRSNYWRVTGPDPLYRPVTIYSYAMVHAAFVPTGASEAAEALPQHVCNILLHLIATALVYLAVSRLGCSVVAAALAGAVFGLHAIHTEVVAGVVGRAELLSMCFGCAALLAFSRGSKPGWIGAAFLLFLGFCSKESALAWAPFLVVFRMAATERGVVGALRDAAIVAAVPLIAYFALRANMLAALPDVPPPDYIANPLAFGELSTRLLTAIKVWGYGLWLTLFPFLLRADYGPAVFTPVTSVADVGFLAALVSLSGLLVVTVRAHRRRPLLFVAGCAFLGFGFLTSNIPLAVGTIFGERLYYIPSVALSFLLAWVFERVPARRVVVGCVAAWLVASVVVLVVHSRVFQNDETLFFAEAKRQPASARMLNAAASVWLGRRQVEPAVQLLRRAVAIEPRYAGAWSQLGFALMNGGALDAAEAALRQGLRAPPPDGEAIDEIHTNLGFVALRRGQADAAQRAFRDAVMTNGSAMPVVVDALLQAGQKAFAVAWLSRLAGDSALAPDIRQRASALAARL